jgi:hypothetical protein
MDRVSRTDPALGLALRRHLVSRCRPGPLRRTQVRSQRSLAQICFGALTIGAAFGALLAEASSAPEEFNPFEWYPTAGAARASVWPTFLHLPSIPLPKPGESPEEPDPIFTTRPLGPPLRLRQVPEPDDSRLDALAFDAAPLGRPQPFAPPVPRPVADLTPRPLGPPRPFEVPTPSASPGPVAILTPAPLGPPRPFEVPTPSASPGPVADLTPAPLAPPRPFEAPPSAPRVPADPTFAGAPLGPPQRLQLAEAFPTAQLSPDPLGPPRPIERVRRSPMADLTPTPFGPPPALRTVTAEIDATPREAATTPPAEGPKTVSVRPTRPAAAPRPRAASPVARAARPTRAATALPPVSTGSVRSSSTLTLRDGTVVLRVRY